MQFLLFALLSFKSSLDARLEGQKERGASAVEYGLLVALIAAVIIIVVTTLGDNIRLAFCDVVGATGGGACGP